MLQGEAGLTEARAVRYFDAARLLYSGDTNSETKFYEPTQYLLGMAAELCLKSFLVRRGFERKKLATRPLNHDLGLLLFEAVKLGLSLPREAAATIVLMSDAHSKHRFRYVPELSETQPFVFRHARTAETLKAVSTLLDYASSNAMALRKHVESGLEWPLSLPSSDLVSPPEVHGLRSATEDTMERLKQALMAGKPNV